MDNILAKLFNPKERRDSLTQYFQNTLLGTINLNSASSYNASKALKISTVYRCVELISNSIASLPLIPYKYNGNWKQKDYSNNLYNILNIQPNEFMSSYTFKKLIIQNCLMLGNTFIYIDRNTKGIINSLSILDSNNIDILLVDNKDIKYKDKVNDITYDKSQIIHIMNYTNNGYIGISTISEAARSLGIAYDSEEHVSNFMKSGGKLSGLLRPVAGNSITASKAQTAKDNFLNQLNSDTNTKASSIIVLGEGLDYQPITVSPKDSQLLESRQFQVIDICRYFNVPPSLAFSETGKFSTAEQQQVDFLNNTLTPWMERIENEFYRKIFTKSEYDTTELKFDVENLMRTDMNSKADYYVKMYQIGAYTTNEVREKNNMDYPVTGGNRALVQVNLQPLDNLFSDQKSNVNNSGL